MRLKSTIQNLEVLDCDFQNELMPCLFQEVVEQRKRLSSQLSSRAPMKIPTTVHCFRTYVSHMVLLYKINNNTDKQVLIPTYILRTQVQNTTFLFAYLLFKPHSSFNKLDMNQFFVALKFFDKLVWLSVLFPKRYVYQ